jgi:hypothetical protein
MDEMRAGARIAPGELKRHPWILPCGKRPKPASLPGNPPGVRGVPAGTSNVRR